MKRIIVNHSGSCGDYHYQEGEPVEVSDDVVRALGPNATVIEEPAEAKKAPKGKAKKEEVEVEEPAEEQKDVKEKEDKMVHGAPVTK